MYPGLRHTESLQRGTGFVSKTQRYHLVPVGFAVFTVIFLVVGAGGPLRILYPTVSVLAGLLLFTKNKPAYVGFVIWMWLLSAFVRRLVDQQAGFQEPSPILLAPYLVTAISGLAVVTRLRSFGLARNIPFVLSLSAILYGTAVGITKFSLIQMLPAIINWLVPVLFAFLLVESHHQYAEIRHSITMSFLYGTMLMGAYAVYQFFIFPPWKCTALGSAVCINASRLADVDPDLVTNGN